MLKHKGNLGASCRKCIQSRKLVPLTGACKLKSLKLSSRKGRLQKPLRSRFHGMHGKVHRPASCNLKVVKNYLIV